MSRASCMVSGFRIVSSVPQYACSRFLKHLAVLLFGPVHALVLVRRDEKMSTNVFSPVAPELVVQNYFNLVQAIAKKIKRRLPAHVDINDLVQTGVIDCFRHPAVTISRARWTSPLTPIPELPAPFWMNCAKPIPALVTIVRRRAKLRIPSFI